MSSRHASASPDVTAFRVVSFRAECQIDVAKLREALPRTIRIPFELSARQPGNLVLGVELRTNQPMNLDQVRAAMRAVEDSHVMIQTLRPVPIELNSLERDWDVR